MSHDIIVSNDIFTIESFYRSVMTQKIKAFLLFTLIWISTEILAAQEESEPATAAVPENAEEQTQATSETASTSTEDKPDTGSQWKVAFYTNSRFQTLFVFDETTYAQLGMDWRVAMVVVPVPEIGVGFVAGAGAWSASAWKAGLRRPALQFTEFGLTVQAIPGDLEIRTAVMGAFVNITGTQLAFVYPAVDLELSYRFPEAFKLFSIGLSAEVAFRQDPGPALGIGITFRVGGTVE